jgi:hypothetical protein
VFSLPGLRDPRHPQRRPPQIHPATSMYNWAWDGAGLTQELPGHWTVRYGGKALYVWDYDQCRLFPVEPGFGWNPAPALDGTARSPLSAGGVTIAPAATFLRSDTHARGDWQGVYGIDGFTVAAQPPRNPNYADIRLPDSSVAVWGTPDGDARALEDFSGAVAVAWWTPLLRPLLDRGRMASAWSSASGLSIDANLHDGVTHQVAVYFVDWDSAGARAETISWSEATSRIVLDTRTISHFSDGQYLVWNLRGHLRLDVTRTAGPSGVVSGLFFR